MGRAKGHPMERAGSEAPLWRAWLKTAEKNPSRIAVLDESQGGAWTFHRLTEEVGSLAQKISSPLKNRVKGKMIHGRDIIAFSLPNGIEWLTLFLAIQKSGAIALPLDSSLNLNAQVHAARELGAHFLWSRAKISTGGGQNGSLLKVPSFHYRTSNIKHREGVGSVGARDLCCIKTTSGTTGKIKSIHCSPHHLLADGMQIIKTMKIRPSDRNLALVPLGHSYGLGNLVMPLILQGTSMVCLPSFVPRQILEIIQRRQVTILPAVPAIFRSLANLESPRGIPSLRLVISAGAPLSMEIAREFFDRFGILIHNFYGSSETGGICYDSSGKAALTGRGIGKPMLGVRVALGKNGQIVVSSPAVAVPCLPPFRGGSLSPVSSFTLPDLGEWNRFGELKIIGRAGSVANLGGRKVHPSEVEHHLRQLDGVWDAWIGVLQDRRGNDYLAAAIESSRKQAEIETKLSHFLPVWKLPKIYLIRPSLPRTGRGKLDVAGIKALLRGTVL